MGAFAPEVGEPAGGNIASHPDGEVEHGDGRHIHAGQASADHEHRDHDNHIADVPNDCAHISTVV
jgi:hypothetical protein